MYFYEKVWYNDIINKEREVKEMRIKMNFDVLEGLLKEYYDDVFVDYEGMDGCYYILEKIGKDVNYWEDEIWEKNMLIGNVIIIDDNEFCIDDESECYF